MVLRQIDPPAEALSAARAGLSLLSGSRQASSREMRRVSIDRLRLTHAQPVYVIGLDDLRAGRGLEAARLSGWRYLVGVDSAAAERAPFALAETVVGPDGSHIFTHLNYGPFVAGTAAALRAAAELPEDDVAQVRLLHIPALYFVALWLHRDGREAALMPVAPTPQGIDANRSYNAQELLNLLGERARRLPDLAADDDRGT